MRCLRKECTSPFAVAALRQSTPKNNLSPLRCRTLLRGSWNDRYPLQTGWSITFQAWFRIVKNARIIQSASLYDFQIREGVAVSEGRSSTVSTKVACDIIAAVGPLRKGLWGSGDKFEVAFRDKEIETEGATGKLSTVIAVAQSLVCVGQLYPFSLQGFTREERVYIYNRLASV